MSSTTSVRVMVLEVSVKEPAELQGEADCAELTIDKWQVAVVTAPRRRDLPKQRIKIEVANIPAYSREPRPLLVNYDFLVVEIRSLQTESEREPGSSRLIIGGR
ncbi:MAG: hypothetical protein KKG98_05900 [Proteobacteria bacterium]|nr:hypothetical protein [Pseudomonadota bacterium]MCG2824689.1 hypothetical protein [Desulfobulbaceae bacterium]